MIVCRRTPGRGHAVGVVEPVGAVTGADGHRENRPALRRRGSAVGHGAAPLGCAARKNGTWRRLPNRRTPLPRLGDRGPDERQRSAEAQRVDCVRIVHWMRNALAHVPKGQQTVVAAALRQAFLQADQAAARQVWRQVADQLRPRWPRLAALMDESEHDVLAYGGFPAQHRTKLHGTNPLERLDEGGKRRADGVGIFPGEASITRRIGGVLREQNDEGQTDRRYMRLEGMAELTPP